MRKDTVIRMSERYFARSSLVKTPVKIEVLPPYGPAMELYADDYSSFENHGRKRIDNNALAMTQDVIEALQEGLSRADAARHVARRAAEEPFQDTYYKRRPSRYHVRKDNTRGRHSRDSSPFANSSDNLTAATGTASHFDLPSIAATHHNMLRMRMLSL